MMSYIFFVEKPQQEYQNMGCLIFAKLPTPLKLLHNYWAGQSIYMLQDSVPMSYSGGASSHATWQKSALRLQLAGTEPKLIRTYMKNIEF